ncbi:hypothetical protein Droror1_Dr00009888 [Drosera rotundifolia]
MKAPSDGVWEHGSTVLHGVGELNGELAAVVDVGGSGHEIWVMKEYGAQDSWTKLMRFSLLESGIQSRGMVKPLAFTKDGRVVMDVDYRLMVYDPRRGVAEKVSLSVEGVCFPTVTSFTPSLFSPFGLN